MKDNKHIQSFNEHQENLNISDVSESKYLVDIEFDAYDRNGNKFNRYEKRRY